MAASPHVDAVSAHQNLQPPSVEATDHDPAVQAYLKPSGIVPDAGMGRRGRRFTSASGYEEGPDGFCKIFLGASL
jgi:hypothetical protein